MKVPEAIRVIERLKNWCGELVEWTDKNISEEKDVHTRNKESVEALTIACEKMRECEELRRYKEMIKEAEKFRKDRNCKYTDNDDANILRILLGCQTIEIREIRVALENKIKEFKQELTKYKQAVEGAGEELPEKLPEKLDIAGYNAIDGLKIQSEHIRYNQGIEACRPILAKHIKEKEELRALDIENAKENEAQNKYIDELQKENAELREGIDKIIQEINEEVNSRPQYPNVGKKGCLRRLVDLRRELKDERI